MNHHQQTLTIVPWKLPNKPILLPNFQNHIWHTVSVLPEKRLRVHPFHQVGQVVNFRRPVEVELRRMDHKTIL